MLNILSEKEKEILSELESKLKLPDKFYLNLLNEDDWSFIIKLHALIEASLTTTLSEILKLSLQEYIDAKNIELNNFFSRLDTSDKTTGKLAFVKGLELLGDDYRGFIHHLSKMRNKFVHDISNVGSTIDNYLMTLDSNVKKDFRYKMSWAILEEIEIEGKSLKGQELFDSNKKVAIWLNAYYCLSELTYCIKYFELSKEKQTYEKEIAELHKDNADKLKNIVKALTKKS